MTALAAELGVDRDSTTRRQFKMAAVKAWKGATICFDTTTGYVTKGQISTTLIPLGIAAETKDNSAGAAGALLLNVDCLALSGGDVTKRLLWRVNDGTVVQGTIGSACYILDDQTVSNTSNGNTRSKLGTVIAIDTVLGVLVALSPL